MRGAWLSDLARTCLPETAGHGDQPRPHDPLLTPALRLRRFPRRLFASCPAGTADADDVARLPSARRTPAARAHGPQIIQDGVDRERCPRALQAVQSGGSTCVLYKGSATLRHVFDLRAHLRGKAVLTGPASATL